MIVRDKMKKLLIRTMLLAFVLIFPVPTVAEMNVGVSISLPPLIVFASPPEMVVIPETYVYVVPDSRDDIYFYNGWWWRPWEGRWYRSRNYNSGWVYYQSVPTFYYRVPSGWRNDYRDHRWQGQPWNYQRIPHQELKKNWSGWQKNNHWEKQQTWGVQGLKPRAETQRPRNADQQKSNAKPQSKEAAKPQKSQPQQREAQPQKSQPQQREVQQQHAPQQKQDAQKQSKPQQGKPENGQGKPDKGQEDKQDRKRREGESYEEIPHVGDGARDDAGIAWRMLLVGI
jgi:hypothetical protein